MKSVLSDFRKQGSKYKPSITSMTPGSHKCGVLRWKCCTNIADWKVTFPRSVTNETFSIKSPLNCRSTNVIHVLECGCKLQYVGRTSQTLRVRMNKHWSNVQKGFMLHSVSRHALSHHNCSFHNFIITPIEQIKEELSNKSKILSRREMYWLYKQYISTIWFWMNL